jgi:ZIP family zinc transporter
MKKKHMLIEEPILTVLLFSSAAAAAAAIGVVPFVILGNVPILWLGGAYALASGMMLGVGYILMAEGLMGQAAVAPILGAVVGVAYTWWTHQFTGNQDVDIPINGPSDEASEYRMILLNGLHSASEGVAIGVAMTINLYLGMFTALALAIHNGAEAMALTWILTRRNIRVRHSSALCIFTNVPQVLLAVCTFAVVSAVPATLPWMIGFASGALVYLVLTELLPCSYENSNHTHVSLLVSFSAGGLVLLEGLLK